MAEKTTIVFGTDPESSAAYLKDGILYGLPPYYFRTHLGVQASSDKKHPIFLEGDGWKAHEDGAAFEFAVKPSTNPKELFDRVQIAAKAVSENILKRFPEECMPLLQFVPTIGFDVERWKKEKKGFFMSTKFGCDPDQDVWNLQAKSQIVDAGKHPERYNGGHIHISGSRMIMENPHLATKIMAMTAGLAATAYSDVPRLENSRLFLYGRPGKFRVQNYGKRFEGIPNTEVGIEYRTISCRWLSDWNIAEKVLGWAEKGVKYLLETPLGAELVEELEIATQETILSTDQFTAGQILDYIDSRI